MLNPHRRINKELVDGSVIIRDIIDVPTTRLNLQRKMLPPMAGFDRAHSRGPGLGTEYAEGIFYATKEVNQALQNHGIERFLRELHQEKKEGVSLYLTTETKPHSNSQKLMEITYKLDAVYNNSEYGIFELTIEVDNDEKNPRAHISNVSILNDHSEILEQR